MSEYPDTDQSIQLEIISTVIDDLQTECSATTTLEVGEQASLLTVTAQDIRFPVSQLNDLLDSGEHTLVSIVVKYEQTLSITIQLSEAVHQVLSTENTDTAAVQDSFQQSARPDSEFLASE